MFLKKSTQRLRNSTNIREACVIREIGGYGPFEKHTNKFLRCWDGVKNFNVIDRGSSRIRKTLESWHTALINHADNNSRPLLNQYPIPLKKNN